MNAPEQLAAESALDKCNFNTAYDLFPDTLPAIVPAPWPTPSSRSDEALQALLKGPQNQADYRQGWRLAAYVKDLEYDGWRFIKFDIQRQGCRRAITEYRLNYQDGATHAALDLRHVKVQA